jgi:hypothetical protein
VAFLRVREDGRTVVRVQVPFVQTNVGGVGGYGLSDVSVKVTNAFKVTPQYGIAAWPQTPQTVDRR